MNKKQLAEKIITALKNAVEDLDTDLSNGLVAYEPTVTSTAKLLLLYRHLGFAKKAEFEKIHAALKLLEGMSFEKDRVIFAGNELRILPEQE